jgi:CRISPR-associated exonuclease Cas4
MSVKPSIYNAYNICPREAWLMSRQITADQSNTFLDIGRMISEKSFSRSTKEIYFPDINAKIDMVMKKNGAFFVCEIKKSSKTLNSGILQLKYYLFLLAQKGIFLKGIIKIPKEKKSINIELAPEDITAIKNTLNDIEILLNSIKIPEVKKLKYCNSCAHFEFCWS